MTAFFSAESRELQARFGTTALADRLLGVTVHPELSDGDRQFIASRELFFLSSVDPDGQPTVSYKGGDAGFVRIVDGRTLAFPSYDGNGMFLSMGNVVATARVGLLFIDFETPFRLRVHGRASIDPADPLLADYPGAQLVVRVAIEALFPNCPRYIPRYQRLASSPYLPKAACAAPAAQWKRIDLFQDVLPARDLAPVAALGGTISFDEYLAKAASGEG